MCERERVRIRQSMGERDRAEAERERVKFGNRKFFGRGMCVMKFQLTIETKKLWAKIFFRI